MNFIKNNILPFLLFANSAFAVAQDLMVMTYNMRLDIESDKENNWQFRKEFFVKQLLEYAPDIIGTQEGLPNQINFIDERLNDYSFTGIGRDGEAGKGEYCAIFYKREKLALINSNTFWLSDTPETSSKGWDAAYIRICTYGLFRVKESGKMFWVFNTHLDNMGVQARKKGLQLIHKKIKEVNKDHKPVILMGDLNAEPDKKIIKRLSRKFVDANSGSNNPSMKSEATFNAFEFHKPHSRRIDYIFFDDKNVEIKNYRVSKTSQNGRYPSDHFPVIVDVIFN